MTDLDKMYAVLTAPDTQPTTTETKADDDLLFVGDMTTQELEAMLAPMLHEAIEREWQKALAAVNATKPAPGITTKGKRITFKG